MNGGSGARIFRARCGTISGERPRLTCPLAALGVGERGRVVHVRNASAPLLQKLLAMAVIPGSEVRVDLTFPAFVFEVGNTRVAVDRAIAERIEVERVIRAEERPRGAKG
ncbi:MAG: ferrous iron transport protein A [Firmicutes bacterium]|nr:ferrous iron transport protein A [Bacillota bacterium]